MTQLEPSALFLGDLDDPWVAAIADALPADAARSPCAGDLPDVWPIEAALVPTLVLHRAILTDADADRLRRLLAPPGTPPRTILAVGPHARFQQLERWVPLVEAVLPEATAAETVGRHLTSPRRPAPVGVRP